MSLKRFILSQKNKLNRFFFARKIRFISKFYGYKKRKIFIDCGTHLGMGFSRLSSLLNLNEEWEVYGFEANPYVYSKYLENINSNEYPTLRNKNISLFNKAVWTSDEGISFSLRGISEKHYDLNFKNGKDEDNPFYKKSWEPPLANLGAKKYGLSKEEIIKIPWDGGSCITEIKNKIKDSSDRDELYTWHEKVEVESIDLSKWIIENFKKTDLIILKLDIEGSEYPVLKKMFENKSIEYVNYAFVEWHDWFIPEYKELTNEFKSKFKKLNVGLKGWG